MAHEILVFFQFIVVPRRHKKHLRVFFPADLDGLADDDHTLVVVLIEPAAVRDDSALRRILHGVQRFDLLVGKILLRVARRGATGKTQRRKGAKQNKNDTARPLF